jgi:DHHC palmitoyltransferase
MADHIIESFELGKFSEILSNENTCFSCQVQRKPRSKHCKYTNKCVQDYDHYCQFLQKPIGKGNHKIFFIGLLLNYLSVFSFLILVWKYIDADIEYEFLSKYVVRVCSRVLEIPLYGAGVSIVSILILWYNSWYLFLEVYSISQGLTCNEILYRYRYKYLYTQITTDAGAKKLRYKNPFNKGFLVNWLEFLTNF